MHIALVIISIVLYALSSEQTNSLACYLRSEPTAKDHLGFSNSKHPSNLGKFKLKCARNNSNHSAVSIVGRHAIYINGRIKINHHNNKPIASFGAEDETVINDEDDLTVFEDRARSDAYKKTEATQHPYSVAILLSTDDDTMSICTGTLITLSWVLTAAHCVVDEQRAFVIATVYAGISVRVAPPTPRLPEESQVIEATKMYAHPKYDAKNTDYDLALIDIRPGFNRTKFVDTIKLSRKRWTHEGYVRCAVTAFGRVQTGQKDPDDYVRKTQLLEVIKPCKFRAEKVGAMRNICTKSKQDYGLCTGDSGGGLVCDGQVKAVASFIRFNSLKNGTKAPKNTCGDVDTLTAFHDVYYSLEWINSLVPLPKEYLVLNNQTKLSNEPSKSTSHVSQAKQFICLITWTVYLFL